MPDLERIEPVDAISSTSRADRWAEAKRRFYQEEVANQSLEDLIEEASEGIMKSQLEDKNIRVKYQHRNLDAQYNSQQDKQSAYSRTKMGMIAIGSLQVLALSLGCIPANTLLTPLQLAGKISSQTFSASLQAAGQGFGLTSAQINQSNESSQENLRYLSERYKDLTNESGQARQQARQLYNESVKTLEKVDREMEQARQSFAAAA